MKAFRKMTLVVSFVLMGVCSTWANVSLDGKSVSSFSSVHQSLSRTRVISPHSKLKVELKRCVASSTTVFIELMVTNMTAEDARLNFGTYSSRAFDTSGKQYRMSVDVAGDGTVMGLFPVNVPVKVTYKITGVSEEVTKFTRVNLAVSKIQDPIKIMDLMIERPDNDVAQIPSAPVDENEDFKVFIKKFVTDPTFQLSRIVFNDLGLKATDDPEAPAVKLSPDNWTFHKATLEDVRKAGQYKTNRALGQDKCVETIWLDNSSFLLEYTYTRINGKWYLTRSFERF